jgi:hypothetical protein
VVSPQFRVIFDDHFDTVRSTDRFASVWQEKAALIKKSPELEPHAEAEIPFSMKAPWNGKKAPQPSTTQVKFNARRHATDNAEQQINPTSQQRPRPCRRNDPRGSHATLRPADSSPAPRGNEGVACPNHYSLRSVSSALRESEGVPPWPFGGPRNAQRRNGVIAFRGHFK